MRRSSFATVLLVGLLSSTGVHGQEPETGAAPPRPSLSPAQDRGRATKAMEGIAKEETTARKDRDMVRLACVQGVRKDAGTTMGVVTEEYLVVTAPPGSTDAQVLQLAREKLEAAADRMEFHLVEARRCTGVDEPEDTENSAKNDSSEPQTIPQSDPTAGPGVQSPVPPVVDPGLPPFASPAE